MQENKSVEGWKRPVRKLYAVVRVTSHDSFRPSVEDITWRNKKMKKKEEGGGGGRGGGDLVLCNTFIGLYNSIVENSVYLNTTSSSRIRLRTLTNSCRMSKVKFVLTRVQVCTSACLLFMLRDVWLWNGVVSVTTFNRIRIHYFATL